MDKCGKRSTCFEWEHVCVRPKGHLGLHRNTPRIRPMLTKQWGDNESK